MKTTKEAIISTSVRLFAERGFDAVSTSMIAGELGITKGALYRHFENKQQIFDKIIEKMFQLDSERAQEDHVPEKKLEEDAQSYQNTQLSDFCAFTRNQFLFWTENEFAMYFRRMITLEQFKSPEMNKLYQDVIALGPILYTEDMMSEMLKSGKLNEAARRFGARNLAMQLFAPLQLSIQLSDGGEDREVLVKHLQDITEDFEKRWKN